VLIGWLVKAASLFAYAHTYRFPDKRLFFDGAQVPILAAVVAVIAIMFSGWIVARASRSQARAMVLLYVVIELMTTALNLTGVFVVSSWSLPLNRVVAAVFFHFGMVLAPVPLITVGITVMSILIGARFFATPETPQFRRATE
jgi:hypothetical protein